MGTRQVYFPDGTSDRLKRRALRVRRLFVELRNRHNRQIEGIYSNYSPGVTLDGGVVSGRQRFCVWLDVVKFGEKVGFNPCLLVMAFNGQLDIAKVIKKIRPEIALKICEGWLTIEVSRIKSELTSADVLLNFECSLREVGPEVILSMVLPRLDVSPVVAAKLCERYAVDVPKQIARDAKFYRRCFPEVLKLVCLD